MPSVLYNELQCLIIYFAFGHDVLKITLNQKLTFSETYEFYFLECIRKCIHPDLLNLTCPLKNNPVILVNSPLRRDQPYFPLSELCDFGKIRPFNVPFLKTAARFLRVSIARKLKTYHKYILKKIHKLYVYGLHVYPQFITFFLNNPILLDRESYLTVSPSQHYIVEKFIHAVSLSKPLPALMLTAF